VTKKRIGRLGVVIVLVFATVACSGDDEPAGPGTVTATDDPTTTTTTTPTPSTTPTPTTDPGATSVTVANFLFQPKTIRVASGDTIELANTHPTTPHTFTVTGEEIDVPLSPQTTEMVEIDLDRGSYPFICTLHETQGMTGTLKVS
jgi:plastocyanin